MVYPQAYLQQKKGTRSWSICLMLFVHSSVQGIITTHSNGKIPLHCFNINTAFPWHNDFHYKDMTVARPSYLYNGSPYVEKTTSLYQDAPPLCTFVQWHSLRINKSCYLKQLWCKLFDYGHIIQFQIQPGKSFVTQSTRLIETSSSAF